MKSIRYFIWLLLMISFQQSYGQLGTSSLSNLRKFKIAVASKRVVLDSLSIIPSSFSIKNVGADSYQLDLVNATLTWIRQPLQDSVEIQYRVFRTKLNATTQQFNFDSIRNNFLADRPFVYQYGKKQGSSIFDFGNINYNGSFGRGISFGNNQDAVLNSSLNLQLNGFIGDSLELTAAVTDNNIPIQPDGNTQDLRDFDKIFLQVKKKGWQLSFGDIDIRQSKNYFLRFYKRLQGASFQTENRIGAHSSNSLLLSGSVAKGKFNRNVLNPQEGNQGPYRLQGASNELYFTILAGTEKVFMDGELLQRGEDQDYVINYNTAEISFTPKHMITKDKRIQVEFEYADRNFLNSNIYLDDELKLNSRLSFNVGFFSNQDSKNSPINQVLDAKQKQFMSAIGDGIDTAFYTEAVRDTFSTGKILYKKMDTLYNNRHDSIFMLSSSNADTLYNVSFTYLGSGKGNYIQLFDATNGKVFKWVQPDQNGAPQGDWQPVILLVSPKKLQILNIGAGYRLNNKTLATVSVAASKYDINLFSRKDKSNDDGFAAKISLAQDESQLRSGRKKLYIQANFGYEFVQKRFKPVERLRNVEFNRDWGLPFTITPADEQVINAGLKMRDSAGSRFGYTVTNYNRSDRFNGWRQQLDYYFAKSGWKFTNSVSLTTTSQPGQKSIFLRPTIDISKQFAKWNNLQTGISYSGEFNRQRSNQGDTLTPLSFAFNIWQAYIRSDEAKLNKWGISYFTRNDWYPVSQNLIQADKSRNFNLNAALMSNDRHQFRFNITFRQLEVLNPVLSKQKADESILGRAEYLVNEWKGLLTGNFLYELGAGQEQKREFTFIEVPAGQGEYTWNDYNNNQLKELNEFELALFPDQRKYIRVNTPTNQYIKANYVQFNYSFDINPSAVIKMNAARGFRKFIGRLSTTSSLQLNRKDIATGSFLFNPFTQKIVDTTLLTLGSFYSNSLFYNRTSTKWGAEFSHTLNSGKSLLTYGIEGRKLRTILIKTRWNVSRSISVNMTLRSVINELATPKFGNRNYQIFQRNAEPAISYVMGSKLRVTASYSYIEKKNKNGFLDKSVSHILGSDFKYNVLGNATLNGRFTVNNIRYSYLPGGSPNSTAGYIMLDGLVPGKNYLWNLELVKRLAGNIEMSLQYDGRKPGSSKMVHIGRASIRALF